MNAILNLEHNEEVWFPCWFSLNKEHNWFPAYQFVCDGDLGAVFQHTLNTCYLFICFITIFHFVLLELFLNPVLNKNLSIKYTLFFALALYMNRFIYFLSLMIGKNFQKPCQVLFFSTFCLINLKGWYWFVLWYTCVMFLSFLFLNHLFMLFKVPMFFLIPKS